MNIRDLLRPVAAVAGAATLAAGAAVAGYVVLSRDRERLKRAVKIAADAVERASYTFAEAREDLADLWAEARDEARRDIEERAFAAAATAEAANEPSAAPEPADDEPPAPAPSPARKRRASGAKRGATKAG